MLNFSKDKKTEPEWPNNEDGTPVAPAYLKHISGGPLDMEMETGLLAAYGIPHIYQYPADGGFGKVILGYSANGLDIFVPETMLEDAQNILNPESIEEDDTQSTM